MANASLQVADIGLMERQNRCNRCEKPTEKLCTGCKKVRYCGPKCQRSCWPEHIFECNPRRPINTADHLALAVCKNLLPTDPQTCIDYGFDRAHTAHNRLKLLGLYSILILWVEVKPITLHQWRTGGTLVQEIKRLHDTPPDVTRSFHYPWFLKNQHIIEPLGSAEFPEANIDRDGKRAWQLVGGLATDSVDKIKREVASFGEERRICFLLYAILLGQWNPGPTWPSMYIKFGFCVCNENSELTLGNLYRELIHRCSFDEFVTAFETSGVFQLFLKHGLSGAQSIPHLEDLLCGSPCANFSVWCLKAAVLSQGGLSKVTPVVAFDYGYINCRNNDEHEELDRVYSKILTLSDDAAINLHKAAMAGRLLEHTSRAVKMTKKEKRMFARVMKSSYPLPNL